MKRQIFLFTIITSFLLSHPVVSNLDIEKFMGRWYVISLIPNWIEDGTNSYDDYSLNEDGSIDIRYHTIKNGKVKSIRQKGYVNEMETARWEVQFISPYVPFFKAPYEVIILDSNYDYMVVGYPNNSFGWIMSRSTDIPDSIYIKIINELELKFDYIGNDFERVVHDKE